MNKLTLLIIILINSVVYGQGIFDSDTINVTITSPDTVINSHLYLNDNSYYSLVDLSNYEIYKDSGAYSNGLKEGTWIEYPIDTSRLYFDNNIRNHPVKKEIYKPELVKIVGNYSEGKKYGEWYEYEKSPISWYISRITEYKNNMKDGNETSFAMFGDTIGVKLYKQGKWVRVVKVFDNGKLIIRSYVNIKNFLVYENYNSKGFLEKETTFYDSLEINGYEKEYYKNGNLKSEFEFLNGYSNGISKTYYDNNVIETITTFNDSGEFDGEFISYYNNGQIATKRIYKNGSPYKIISQFSKDGNPLEKGDLDKGTGSIRYYNEKNKLRKIIYYKNGIEIKVIEYEK